MTEAATASWSVKRRIVALFVLCGLLPVAATMLVSSAHVEDALVAQRVALLRGAASNYATVLFDRLSIADRLAHTVSASGRRPTGTEVMGRHFRAMVAIEAGRARVLFGEPSRMPTAGDIAGAERSPLAGGGRLIVFSDGQAATGIWIVVQEQESPSSQLVFEVDPGYLWAPHDEMPYLTDMCVITASGQVLDCRRPPPAAEFGPSRSGTGDLKRADFKWDSDGVTYLSGIRELFLGGRFGAGSWLVVASQPEEYALEPVRAVAARAVTHGVLGVLGAALRGRG